VLLDEQRATAVERFAQRRAELGEPLLGDYYRDLIPLSKPGPGEQYAFEVDLDACSGCKACVAACHSLNGLDEDEIWRNVGLLVGGTEERPFVQHVTTACHHCLDPACLEGCPVLAYEKDADTGIVRHLDDQCIGCQYCIFMCPYDVPRYNPAKGIVRKCDMCHDRLAVGEAPACVQSCPSRAIRIRTVNIQQVVDESEANQFLPTAPEPGITLPTTVYKSARPLPRNLLPADYFSANRQHSHLPLVFMLVLTQLSVGAFLVSQLLVSGPWAHQEIAATVRPSHALAGLVVGLIGMNAAVFHVGRPKRAYRALLGLRTSWMSREILALGVFAGFACLHAAAIGIAVSRPDWLPAADGLGYLTAASGLAAVGCSVMIYAKTHRPYWSAGRTATRFLLTAVVLGVPVALLISLAGCLWSQALSTHAVMRDYGQALCLALMAAVGAKLLIESAIFVRLRQRQFSPLKRTALLLTGELSMTTLLRYFFGIVGGVLLPWVLLAGEATDASGAGFHPLFLGLVVTFMLALLVVGELLERYLFFAASVAPKMPGAPAT